jgi:glycosyltransferase involved in cell wall biosynthesis
MSSREVRVAAVSAQGAPAPAFRIRVLALREPLAAEGVVLEPVALFGEEESAAFYGGSPPRRLRLFAAARRSYARRLASLDARTVLVQRQVDLVPSLRLERRVAEGRRLVWDVDDAIWRSYNRWPRAALKGMPRRVGWLAQTADHVIAANAVLAEHLGRYTDRISVVPSAVETRGLAVRKHADAEELVLGWIGSYSTVRYLAGVREPLARLARELPERRIRLLVLGGRLAPIAGVEVECLPWSVERERAALARMDVGLVPQPDTPWTRGKSAFKALQYMAAGIPAVADDVGVVAANVGGGGIVVRSAEEWVDALLRLARAPDLRQQLGDRGRARVEADFSVERWAPVVAAILRDDAP